MWAISIAQKGKDVTIAFHGIGGDWNLNKKIVIAWLTIFWSSYLCACCTPEGFLNILFFFGFNSRMHLRIFKYKKQKCYRPNRTDNAENVKHRRPSRIGGRQQAGQRHRNYRSKLCTWKQIVFVYCLAVWGSFTNEGKNN